MYENYLLQVLFVSNYFKYNIIMSFVVINGVNVKIPSSLKELLCFLFPATISTVKRSYLADELTFVRF
jgi:hypothetical protein